MISHAHDIDKINSFIYYPSLIRDGIVAAAGYSRHPVGFHCISRLDRIHNPPSEIWVLAPVYMEEQWLNSEPPQDD